MNLTPEQIQDGLAAAAALFRGERIEYFNPAAGRWLETRTINAAFHHRPVRKPEPRPWSKPEDVPGPVCYLRSKDVPVGWTMIIAASPHGYACANSLSDGTPLGCIRLPWWRLEECEYSTDRVTWKPCVVEVAE